MNPGNLINPTSIQYANGFCFHTMLGKGAYGAVYEGNLTTENFQMGMKIAVKTISANDQSSKEACEKEIEIMKRLVNVPNIVKLLGSEYNETKREYWIAMELGKSVAAMLTDLAYNQGLSKELLTDLIQDTVSALAALHNEKIAHRDIKPDNILWYPNNGSMKGRKSKCLYKLCDFGCSKQGTLQTIRGTIGYLDPEIVARLQLANNSHLVDTGAKKYATEQVDLWSLGCTIVECATGAKTFPSDMGQYKACVENIRNTAMYISATFEDGKPKYCDHIKNDSYPLWFRHVLKQMVLSMFYNPKMPDLIAMVQSLISSKECNFYILQTTELITHKNYAYFEGGSIVGSNGPSLWNELNLPPEFGECAFMTANKIVTTKNFEATANKTYIVFSLEHKLWKTINIDILNFGVDQKRRNMMVAYKLETMTNALITAYKQTMQVMTDNIEILSDGHRRFGSQFEELQRLEVADLTDIVNFMTVATNGQDLNWRQMLSSISSINEPIQAATRFSEQITRYSGVLQNYIRAVDMDYNPVNCVLELSKDVLTQNNTDKFACEILQDSLRKYNELIAQLETALYSAEGLMYHVRILKRLHDLEEKLREKSTQVGRPLMENAKSVNNALSANQLDQADVQRTLNQIIQYKEQNNQAQNIYQSLNQLHALINPQMNNNNFLTNNLQQPRF